MSQNRPKRVFITATYDLAEARNLAAEAIRRTGNVATTVEPFEPTTFVGRRVYDSDLLLFLVGPRYGSPAFANVSFPDYEYRLAQLAGIPVAAIILTNIQEADARQRWFLQQFNPQFKIESTSENLLSTVVSFAVEVLPRLPHHRRREEATGILRIFGMVPVATAEVTDYLRDLERAYNGILLFSEIITDAFVGLRSDLPHRIIAQRDTTSFLSASERLFLLRASFASPGVWEFLGKLNPLEVIRQYLNDRHERRKDREYREAEERRRLSLENELLKNRVVSERLKLARDLGVPERSLTFAANRLLFEPLRQLDEPQDRGVIQSAELVDPPRIAEHEESSAPSDS